MTIDGKNEVAKFNRIATEYSQLHAQNLESSGESPEYFAEYKVACLKRLGVSATDSILDYGCGIGNLTTLLARDFQTVVGVDPSAESLAVARERLPDVTFVDDVAALGTTSFRVAILAGVLHHVPVADRPAVVRTVLERLEPGGRLFVFEHNPFNPLTVRTVETCPFDDDAILLKPRELRSLLGSAGAAEVRQDYIVFFPHALRFLRGMEPALRFFFLGAQTMTIATRSA